MSETCESCGFDCCNFKVIDTADGLYIICPKCFDEREAMNNFLNDYLIKNNITMADIEKEVEEENKRLAK